MRNQAALTSELHSWLRCDFICQIVIDQQSQMADGYSLAKINVIFLFITEFSIYYKY